MANLSTEKSTAGNRAVTGQLNVKVNTEQKVLEAFQLFDIGGSLVFQFGDASSTTGVISTKFPKDKLGQTLLHGPAEVNVSYLVNGVIVPWSGGSISVSEDGAGGYEGGLDALISASGSSWNLTEGKFTVRNE